MDLARRQELFDHIQPMDKSQSNINEVCSRTNHVLHTVEDPIIDNFVEYERQSQMPRKLYRLGTQTEAFLRDEVRDGRRIFK